MGKFLGSTVCAGYCSDSNRDVSKRLPSSDVFLFVLRCLAYEKDDVDELSMDGYLDDVYLPVAGNRYALES